MKSIAFWEPAKDYFKQEADILDAIKGCLKRGELVLGFGSEISNFEERFAKYIGVKYAVMTGGGTHSLLLAYRALGISGNWNYLIDLINRYASKEIRITRS